LLVLGSAAALPAVRPRVLLQTTLRTSSALAALPDGGNALRAADGGLVLIVQCGLQILFLRTFYRSPSGVVHERSASLGRR
jgi:hypothetical protein